MKNETMDAALPVIAEMEISTISDGDLEAAFRRVVSEHKDAVVSIHQSMVDATDAYRKYLDESYEPLEDVAKKDRATLNKAEKNIADKYASLKEAYEKPLENVESNIKSIRNAIKKASGIVDGAVKNHEEKQKKAKREEIQKYFDNKKFELVPLDRIFDQKWLNKGTKMKDIHTEIDAAIARIYQDIEVLERIPDHGTAAKAFYLEHLDMGAALRQVDTLKENVAKLAREQADREARVTQEQCEQNDKTERQEKVDASKETRSQGFVDEALGLPEGTTAAQAKSEIIECTLTFKGTKEQLLKLREYMTAQGIPYRKALVLASYDDARQVACNKGIAEDIHSILYVPNAA